MWLTLPQLVGAISPLPILIGCASGGATAKAAKRYGSSFGKGVLLIETRSVSEAEPPDHQSASR